MSMGTVPTVFVSSTCYDLKQVRKDIKDSIETLGLQPILSDHSSFPIDPDMGTIDNCLKVVDERADILLLIVGGRYGTPTEQGKSVTNMEYLRARGKGIPVYVFVQNSILNILSVWKANPNANFQNVADSQKLFEFVESLRSIDNVWVLGFDVVQDIYAAFREQLAYLFMDGLQLRSRVKSAGLSARLLRLQGKPLRIVIERPPFWEYLLFAHCLAQELSEVEAQKLDLHYGVVLGTGEHLKEPAEIFDWMDRKIIQAERIVDTSKQLVNVALQEALGPPGSPGDAERIVYVSQRLAETYRHAVEWATETKRVSAPELFEKAISVLGTFLDDMIENIETFSKHVIKEFEAAIAAPRGPNDPPRELMFTLTINISNADEFNAELDRIRRCSARLTF